MSVILSRSVAAPVIDTARERGLSLRLAGSAPEVFGTILVRFGSGELDVTPGAPNWWKDNAGRVGVKIPLKSSGFVTSWLRGFAIGESVELEITIPRALESGEEVLLSIQAQTIPLGNEEALEGIVPSVPVQCVADRYPNAESGFRLWRAARAAKRRA